MKIITQLAGVVEQGSAEPISGIVNSVHHEVSKGCFIHIGMNGRGLIAWRGNTAIRIPMQDMLALLTQAEAGLMPAPKHES